MNRIEVQIRLRDKNYRLGASPQPPLTDVEWRDALREVFRLLRTVVDPTVKVKGYNRYDAYRRRYTAGKKPLEVVGKGCTVVRDGLG